jgi:hypothetical protein
MSKNKRRSVPVPFSDREDNLYNWLKSRDKPSATYIKDLIRQDMLNNGLPAISQLQAINKANIQANDQKENISTKQGSAISQILNRVKK